MSSLTERFEMRLDIDMLGRLDDWRTQQSEPLSRAEAIRRLIDSGLRPTSNGHVSLSDGEKLITSMLCDLHRHLNVDGSNEPDLIESALVGGHYWGLQMSYPGLFHDDRDNETIVREVGDILDMWWFLEHGYVALSKQEKEQVETEAAPTGKNVRFPGFDGNDETDHLGVAQFFINKMGRFQSFKDHDLNSHFPMIHRYRRMLVVFQQMRPTLIGGELNAKQIIELLLASAHPKAQP